MPHSRNAWLGLVAVVVVGLLSWFVSQGGSSDGGHQGGTVSTVAASSLPVQAQQTLALIDKGGPFPYDRDGIVFENREGLLPAEKLGYYHEYTVITPGSEDRGARRIIAGSSRELYYTDDHYNSFERITR
jgi:ribonuclease T1